MRMYLDLIHKILKYAESNADGENRCVPEFDVFCPEDVDYHVLLCEQAGFLTAKMDGTIKGTRKPSRSIIHLTWKGQMEVRKL